MSIKWWWGPCSTAECRHLMRMWPGNTADVTTLSPSWIAVAVLHKQGVNVPIAMISRTRSADLEAQVGPTLVGARLAGSGKSARQVWPTPAFSRVHGPREGTDTEPPPLQ